MYKKIIFKDEASSFFCEKLSELKRNFEVTHIACSSENYTNTINPNQENLNGGLIDIILLSIGVGAESDLHVYSIQDKNIDKECFFYDFGVDFIANNNFIIMVERSQDTAFFHQIYYIQNSTLKNIEIHLTC
jgi:hypothetical protein